MRKENSMKEEDKKYLWTVEKGKKKNSRNSQETLDFTFVSK